MSERKDEDNKLQIGERVVWFTNDENPVRGTLRWLGEIEHISKDQVGGVMLDKPFGTNNGSWNKTRYFKCKPKHGLFVDVNALMRASDMGDSSSASDEEEEEEEASNNDDENSYSASGEETNSEDESEDSNDDVTKFCQIASDLEKVVNITEEDDKENGWSCSRCTFSNRHIRQDCEICGVEPPKGYEVPYGVEEQNDLGWKCSECTFVNYPTLSECEMCSAEHPADYEIPKKYVEEEMVRILNEDQILKDIEKAQEVDRKLNWDINLRLDNIKLLKNEEPFECKICFSEIEVGTGVRLRNCLHHFCVECLRYIIRHCEEAVVKCPFQDDEYSCDTVLEEREIREIVDDETFDRFISRSLTTAESTSKESFHCKTVDCKGWCFYEFGVIEFLCPLCCHANCIPCQANHETMSCKNYQDRLEILARTDGEAKKTRESLKLLLNKGEAMKCPTCGVIIIKNGGCDGLTCGNCKVELCWATKGLRWGPKGKGDLTGGCRCKAFGELCHPNCGNCH